MRTTDLKHVDREFYSARLVRPAVVDVPEWPFLQVRGAGSPDGPAYQDAVAGLFPVAYALRAEVRARTGEVFVVMPLETLWGWPGSPAAPPPADRDEWTWTAMVRVPDAVTAEMVAEVLPTVHRPQARPHGIHYGRFREGQSAQVMHLGRADTRDAAVATLHRFIADRGGAPSGARHEIHLSDPRRVPADRVRTLIRQPFSVA